MLAAGMQTIRRPVGLRQESITDPPPDQIMVPL